MNAQSPVSTYRYASITSHRHKYTPSGWSDGAYVPMYGDQECISWRSSSPVAATKSAPDTTTGHYLGQLTSVKAVKSPLLSGPKAEPVVPTKELLVKQHRSQRARNAANQRHARAKKKQQSDDLKDNGVPSAYLATTDFGGVERKREKYRGKNRLAAAKCRFLKRKTIEMLEEQHRELCAANSYAKRQERALRDELTRLRTIALNHSPVMPGCNCASLHRYNTGRAHDVVLGWT